MAASGGRWPPPRVPAAARRAAERVLAVAAEINDRGERTPRRTRLPLSPRRPANLDDALTVQAVSMMTRARDRSYAWYSLAREALKEHGLAKADDRQLVAAARDALGRRDLQESMRLDLCRWRHEDSSAATSLLIDPS